MIEEPFYQAAVPMESLDEIDLEGRFVAVPDDWFVAVTDVVGSTKAIAAGRYKDVNLIGAAMIPAIMERVNEELPYLFNGDGAMVLVSPEHKSAVEESLAGLVHLSEANFNLDLRAALFNVGELRAQALSLSVGRLRLIGERALAQFRGTMIAEFDRRIRAEPGRHIAPSKKLAEQLSLNSLSCRWHEQPARNGAILSILILPREGHGDPLIRFLALLRELTNGELASLNPISTTLANYQSLFQAIRSEARLHARILSGSFARRLLSIAISVPLFKWGLSKRYDWAELYLRNLSMHSDFHKLDEALRLVIDCTPEQAEKVMSFLDSEYAARTLNFGLHRSAACQMTCYVESLSDAAHVHFVDGCDGGYVAAATALKAQLQGD